MKWALLFVLGGIYCIFAEKYPAMVIIPFFLGTFLLLWAFEWIWDKCLSD